MEDRVDQRDLLFPELVLGAARRAAQELLDGGHAERCRGDDGGGQLPGGVEGGSGFGEPHQQAVFEGGLGRDQLGR